VLHHLHWSSVNTQAEYHVSNKSLFFILHAARNIVHVQVHVHVKVQVHVHAHGRVNAHINAYVHAYVHALVKCPVHTYVNAHIHDFFLSQPLVEKNIPESGILLKGNL
jgi:hypothetical protein